MISSRIKVHSRFAEITRDVEALAKRAVDAAAREGAATAERVARLGLKGKAGMQVVPAHGEVDGFASGFRSDARGERGQPIAVFHDVGTYGSYRGRGTPRRRSRARKVQDVNPETGEQTGIEALGFFAAGRREGRKALRRTIDAGL